MSSVLFFSLVFLYFPRSPIMTLYSFKIGQREREKRSSKLMREILQVLIWDREKKICSGHKILAHCFLFAFQSSLMNAKVFGIWPFVRERHSLERKTQANWRKVRFRLRVIPITHVYTLICNKSHWIFVKSIIHIYYKLQVIYLGPNPKDTFYTSHFVEIGKVKFKISEPAHSQLIKLSVLNEIL